MRTVIVLNGEPCEFDFLKSDKIIACDGALEYLKKRDITPDVVLGDFDSLGYVPENALTVPAEKDFTDGEMALDHAINKGLKNLVFICAGGLREDHFLGNLALLKMADEKGATARLETRYSSVVYTKSVVKLPVFVGQTVSVIAEDSAHIKSSVGLKYPYNDVILKNASTLGISNVATSDEILLDLISGAIFVFLNKKQ